MDITRATLTPATEAEWLGLRKNDLTSTEMSALFDCSPYATEFELFHRKKKNIAESFDENERMKWGKRLEPVIAAGIAEDNGLIIEPFKTYMRIDGLRLGASFDFRIVGVKPDSPYFQMFEDNGPGIMEIKNVDSLQFKRGWIDGAEEIEAPPHIEIQVQHQLEVADLGWSLICPLVGGNTPKTLTRLRDHQIGAMIREKAAAFWARYDADLPPEPNYSKDLSTLKKLYVDNDASSVDLSDDPRVFDICTRYKAAGAAEKAAKEKKDAAMAELLPIIKAAKSITAKGFKISAGTNKESFRCYDRAGFEKVTITVSQVPTAHIEATVAPFRNVRITETA